MIDKSSLNFFKKNGYLIIKNIIPKKNINNIFIALDNLFKKSKYSNEYKKNKTNNLLKKISSIFIYIKKNDPKFGSELYEFFKLSLVLNKFLDENFFQILSKKININTYNIVNQQSVLRFDKPNEKKTIIDYHQDYMSDFNEKKKTNLSVLQFGAHLKEQTVIMVVWKYWKAVINQDGKPLLMGVR